MSRAPISRRVLLRRAALAVASVGLAACAPAPPRPTPPPTRSPDAAPPAPKPPVAASPALTASVGPVAAASLSPTPLVAASPSPLAGASQPPTPAPSRTPAPAGPRLALSLALGDEPATLDPHLATGRSFEALWPNLFDTLVARDARNVLGPGLADSWRRLDDQTWELQLRRGPRFSNGEALDAEAVVASLRRAMAGPPGSFGRTRLETLAAVEARGPTTVRVATRGPDPLLPARLASPAAAILPPAYLRSVGEAAFGQAPVGSGPFKLARWERGRLLLLEPNPAHHLGAPTAESVVVRFLSDEARADALLAGTVDLADALPAGRLRELENGRVDPRRLPLPRVYLLVLDPRQKPLDDVRARKALNHLIDVRRLVRALYGGLAAPLATVVPRSAPGYDPSVPPYPFDPGRASLLLMEAGLPLGFELELSWPTGGEGELARLAEAIADDLGRARIRVKAQPLELPTFAQRRDAGALVGAYPETHDAWAADASAAMRWLLRGEGSLRYRNPQVLATLDRADGVGDSYLRGRLLGEAQQALREDAACVPLFQLETLLGISRRLAFEPRLDGALYLRATSARG